MEKVILYMAKTFGMALIEKRIRRKGILFYLKTIQAIRRTTLGLLLATLFIHLMFVGLVGSVVAGILLIEQISTQAKLQIILGISLTSFIIPLVFLLIFFSERVWFKASGADKMIE